MDIVICGFGRAAKSLTEKILQLDEHKLIMILCRRESQNAHKDIGEILYGDNISLGIIITPVNEAYEQLREKNVDVIIDFSNREMTISLVGLCGKLKSNLVICTTNHKVEEITQFQEMTGTFEIGIVYAPNLTIGINLLMDFVSKVAKVLPDFEFEIIEKHPKNKSRPTATAVMISQSVNRGDIPIHSVRLNGYVGIHEVYATDGDEKITVQHESFSRRAFANGAIAAADFVKERKGFYLMKDVIQALEEKAVLNDGQFF